MDWVETQIESRGIRDPGVLKAMRKVPRHRFVPELESEYAYEDNPLSIGYGQTISQPYVVALMTELLRLQPDFRVLEIGTGSGYQAAVLAELVGEVYSLEIVEALAQRAAGTLRDTGYANVHVLHSDGYSGWGEFAPFDAIIVTAATPEVPPPLLEQLKVGGRMVIPLGAFSRAQQLVLLEKTAGRPRLTEVIPVMFVPFTRAEGAGKD